MDFVALVSGGKDSIYSIKCSIDQGHKLVGLLYMKNPSSYVDSYMYQTVGSEVVEHFGKCLDVPLFTSVSQCKAIDTELNYTGDREDEVEDLFKALSEIKKKIKFEAISSGAILSRYQKNRVEHVANRLNLVSLSPLWQRDQKILLKEMLDYEIEAFVVKVASSSLDKSYLGKHIRSIYESNALLDDNYCGEGGEYESVVLDCPLFKYKLEYKDFTIVNHPEEQDGFGSVFYCVFNGLRLIKK
ncbi:ATP-binding domain protein 4 [Nosema bombycis CQ1]|uniref:Diphthine--ammonia ligase n=1 Tax=Nosema bombycis (strain CQ1 / CVCC 102059) TaxID=578461 RepID=R0KX47_NOSB1|nr:ATP-binding domain protein 4 [Nosema bombycis CQ1]|eukprot:EOB15456.1 ATP-binding domain protein 4 [Nosema bombycis CQ1]